MSVQPRAIHQFHAGVASGDGITSSMIFTQQMLRGLGFESEIFSTQIPQELTGIVRSMDSYPDSPDHILFLHHSLGNRHAAWVEGLKSRLVLIYHNITPPEFFMPGHPLRGLCELGLEQLTQWRPLFASAIGDSELNTSELVKRGYARAVTIPLLVDLNRLRSVQADPSLLIRLENAFNMVFVGRVAENKCQHDVISIFAHLRRWLDIPARLLLVGDNSLKDYHRRLDHMCADLMLGDSVEFTGKISDESLSAIYQRADVFVCMSEHEGFGMPLIEAMAHDVPVIAYDNSSIGATMGEGGLLLDHKDDRKTAALIKILAEEPELRRRVLRAQRNNLRRFERPVVLRALSEFLAGIGVAVPSLPQAVPYSRPAIRLEGPFDSSYSLAIVNREFARALHRRGMEVVLHDADGPGDKAPDAVFLSNDAECRDMWQRGNSEPGADVLLRDMYPPRVSHMRAPTNGLSNYAWEESGFPRSYVSEFNRSLTHITVLSHYVRKVLLDNGVRVPVTVSGAGVDHLLDIKIAKSRRNLGPEGFRFLHVSSCFPRKGADVLLEAFGQTFTRVDGVSLVIKTFPNIHNDIVSQLRRFQERHPEAPPVILINEDIGEAEIADLYRRCDALVAPSRGEGFGMPIAEAMLFGKPVITTAFGGQMDFCTPGNSWLVDYQFDYAKTHMDQFDSVWAEPDLADLARALREACEALPEERQRRAQAGKDALLANWRWEHVAERNLQAIAALDTRPAPQDLPKVGWVSTWNVRCGIAAYARALSGALPAGQMVILANRTDERISVDEEYVTRCWLSGGEDTLDDLYHKIRDSGVTSVVVQFNFGFFNLASLGNLIIRLKQDGVGVHIFFHATVESLHLGRALNLTRIAAQLALADRLYVHGIDDLNRMKKLGLVDNVILFPHGAHVPASMPQPPVAQPEPVNRLITSFGYMLPHKGFLQLIEAFDILRRSQPGVRLEMLNASYPAAESEIELRRCRDAIAASPHRDDITLVSDFLPDEEVLARLSQSDLIVFPYQKTGESSSAAVRFGLASGRPVACTPLPIFRDVANVTFQLPGATPSDIATGIAALFSDPRKLQKIGEIQASWLAEHDWQVVSTRLWNIIRACL